MSTVQYTAVAEPQEQCTNSLAVRRNPSRAFFAGRNATMIAMPRYVCTISSLFKARLGIKKSARIFIENRLLGAPKD